MQEDTGDLVGLGAEQSLIVPESAVEIPHTCIKEYSRFWEGKNNNISWIEAE